ncbi:hypothetical protein C1H46_029075 [Malus baccata]|uniref:Uncharacterized protein n=1 Tax=Malus baccata TaxID=106549 RepID=A0A540LFY4_MALBA|nr:hypothetical protein C1H46_029075 [Malus baccata]
MDHKREIPTNPRGQNFNEIQLESQWDSSGKTRVSSGTAAGHRGWSKIIDLDGKLHRGDEKRSRDEMTSYRSLLGLDIGSTASFGPWLQAVTCSRAHRMERLDPGSSTTWLSSGSLAM